MRLRRLHRKIVVVDRSVGFVGGINIEDDYSTADPAVRATDARFDYAVRVTGPIVLELTEAIDLLWLRLNKSRQLHLKHLRTRLRYFKRHMASPNAFSNSRSAPPVNTPAATTANMHAAVILRDNLRYRRTIEQAYLFHIAAAKNEIIIANAYFLPGGKLRRALIDAAKRGVKVRLLLQGKIEYQMQYHATRWIYDLFLREGIEIYEYLPSFLHAKVAVIDGVSIVGSSNLDPFSLLLAREANVLIDDAGFTAQLRRSLEKAMTRGRRIVELTLYGRRPFLGRIADGLCYLLLRIGVTLSGKSDQY
jgi:cardiolipin synthase